MTGTLADVNLALIAVAFVPATDNDQDTSITTHIEDAAATGPSDGAIALTVTAVNDSPVIGDQSFTVVETSADGTIVGNVAATDPDSGQTLSFQITAGNSSGAFAIDTYGQITVNDHTALNSSFDEPTVSTAVSAVNCCRGNESF